MPSALRPRGYDKLTEAKRTQLLTEVMSGQAKWTCFPASTSMSLNETCVICNTHINTLDDPWNFTIWNHKPKGGGPYDDGTTKSYSHIDCLLDKHAEIHPDNVVTTPGDTRSCFMSEENIAKWESRFLNYASKTSYGGARYEISACQSGEPSA